jgi:hypothetical protein
VKWWWALYVVCMLGATVAIVSFEPFWFLMNMLGVAVSGWELVKKRER